MFWQSLDAFLTRIRSKRQPLSLVIDGVVVALSWQFTYLFRLGFERWWSARPWYDPYVMLGIVACYLAIFKLFQIPKGMWRFSGFGEVKRIVLACLIAGAISAIAVLMAQLSAVPRSVLTLHPFFSIIGVAGVRMLYRTLYEHMREEISGSAAEGRRALVLGAGDAARRLVAGIQHDGWTVVGLLDDDLSKHDSRVAGVPVLGSLDTLSRHAATHGITHVIIAMPSAPSAVRRRAIDLASGTGLPVLTVPGTDELHPGTGTSLRDVRPEDLLGREPVQLDEGNIADCLSGKTVLITGAGGSIGSELCRQVARYGPLKLVLFELCEFNLYAIEQELSECFPHLTLVKLIGDVKDLEQLRRVFSYWRPEVVFHAAAYKHVPLMEQENAWTCLRNNTLGTFQAAQAAAECEAERFVLISTDKAVNPTNVMGATKRAAEMVVSVMAQRHPSTRFLAVRFGNVLGSSGSVIPKFKEQIARGGPVTVTHPDIIRYFMTIPEAARLVVQATAIGESGQVMVLDMGEPVKILELARDMIRLSGHSLEEIPIVFSGLRPGEKLYEELLADADATLPTPNPRIMIARIASSKADVDAMIGWICSRTSADDRTVQAFLSQQIPEYQVQLPRGTGAAP
jgi:FlaA1/EpsC-like NDP-sugar epimerase